MIILIASKDYLEREIASEVLTPLDSFPENQSPMYPQILDW
jgi:hypothetical protein